MSRTIRHPHGIPWKCTLCGLEFSSRRKLSQHSRECHPCPKGQPWNKGLTSDTDPRVQKRGETLRHRIQSGEVFPSWKGRHHTEEQRKKISESRKRYLKEHPDKVPYVLNHSSKESFPERLFRNAFLNEGFPTFVQDKYVQGYFLDFAFEGLRKYVEVDGEQHYLDQRIVEHDMVRQRNLDKTEWKCVCRIRWAKFQKLTNDCKHKFLLGLKAKVLGS